MEEIIEQKYEKLSLLNCIESHPKVSIIVPVFNIKGILLKKSIRSILNQTYNNIEVIVVDDGAESETAKLCDQLKKEDERVIVIHQKNRGVSVARNNGLDVASGQYIAYVDADDVLFSESISIGVAVAEKFEADMVIGGTKDIISDYDEDHTKEKHVKVKLIRNYDDLRKVYLNNPDKGFQEWCPPGYISRGVYSRLIKTSIAKQLKFSTNLKIGEDVVWNLRLLSKCRSIYICDNIWYGYRYRNDSAIHKYHGDRIETISNYLSCIREENYEYYQVDKVSFAYNAVIELYCILRYEMLFEIKKSMKGKMTAKELLSSEQWRFLNEKRISKKLPMKYRILLTSINNKWWILYIGLRDLFK